MADGARGEGNAGSGGEQAAAQRRRRAGVAGGAGGRLRMTENRVGCVDACALCPVPTCVLEGERIERFIVHHSGNNVTIRRASLARDKVTLDVSVFKRPSSRDKAHIRVSRMDKEWSHARTNRRAKIGLSPLGALSRHSADSAPTDVTAHTVHRTNACHLAFRNLGTAVARCTSQSPPVSGSSPRLRAAASDPRRL